MLRAHRTRPARPTVIAGLAIAATILIAIGSGARALRGSGPESVHDPATLRSRITVCGRDLKGPGPIETLASMHAVLANPVLVDPAPFAPCPAGACTRVADGPCATVVYIRVGDDAYVPYELVGGP
jgi:hypothetical protein